jgi:hypothetical protein
LVTLYGKSVAKPVLALVLVMLAQLGGTARPNRAIDQLDRAVRQPLPSLPPTPAPPRASQVWVPDRYFPTPNGQTLHVPGHWEQQLNNQQYYAPPLPACTQSGQCVTTPGGVKELPPEIRQSP